MIRVQSDSGQMACEICGAAIPRDRMEAVPDARLCVRCQGRVERCGWPVDAFGGTTGTEPTPGISVQGSGGSTPGIFEVHDDRVVVGAWSEDLFAMIFKGGEVRALLRSRRNEEAGSLVRSLPVEAQAALVALDEDPEEMLSLTGKDTSGRGSYSPEVVARLPSEVLTGLIAPRTEYLAVNPKVIEAMSSETLQRVIGETLEMVDHPEHRTRVLWDWMQALAAVEDQNQVAELLRGVDPALMEEAILDRMKSLRLHGLFSARGSEAVSRFRFFSESSAVGVYPGEFIRNPETAGVLNALYEAAPDLLKQIVRGAWERARGGWDEWTY